MTDVTRIGGTRSYCQFGEKHETILLFVSHQKPTYMQKKIKQNQSNIYCPQRPQKNIRHRTGRPVCKQQSADNKNRIGNR